MKNNPYKNFLKEELILRDHLAIDRTILANERTILAYIRTSLAVIAAGATLIHFFDAVWIKTFGIFLVLFGTAIIVVGIGRFKKMQKSINQIKRS